MSQYPAQAVNAGGFHFKICYAVMSEIKMRESLNKVRTAQAKSQYSPLGTVESWTGNRYALVKIFHEMLDQPGAATAYIGMRKLVMQLGLGNKCMNQVFFFVVIFVAVEVQEVIYTEAMRGSYKTVNRDIRLQRPRCSYTDDLQVRQLFFH